MDGRAGEGRAYGNLGTCHMHLNENVKAVAYFEAQHALAISLKLAHVQSHTALNMGVALTLLVQAGRQGPATDADQAPGPHSHSSESACLNDRVREAAKWLQAAFYGRPPPLQSPGPASGTRWPGSSPPATDTRGKGSRTPRPPPPGRPPPLQSPGPARLDGLGEVTLRTIRDAEVSVRLALPKPGRPPPLQSPGPACGTRWPSHSPPANHTRCRGSRTPGPPPPGRPPPLQLLGAHCGAQAPWKCSPATDTLCRVQ